MIWHLPHIRAIAAHVGESVTLIAKPRSAADQIFSAEQTVRDVFWFDRNPERHHGEHDGVSGFRRAVAALRARQFDAIYIMHHGRSAAFMAMAAGIPARYGYGYGMQRWFLNRPPYLPNSVLKQHPYKQATAWLQVAGIPLAQAEPALPVRESDLRTVRDRIGNDLPPVAIGIAVSAEYRQWGASRFVALANALAARGVTNLILVGGAMEAPLAAEIQAATHARSIATAINWNLAELAALLRLSAYYVGNDTGAMNIAAAVGTRTYALFGASPPFYHSPRIVGITPPGGWSRTDGMSRITLEQVLAAIELDQASIRA